MRHSMQVHLTKIKRPYWGFDWIHPETGYVLSPYITQGKKLYVIYYNGKAVFFDTFSAAMYCLKRSIKSKHKNVKRMKCKD